MVVPFGREESNVMSWRRAKMMMAAVRPWLAGILKLLERPGNTLGIWLLRFICLEH
jgi:hypothetical protein